MVTNGDSGARDPSSQVHRTLINSLSTTGAQETWVQNNVVVDSTVKMTPKQVLVYGHRRQPERNAIWEKTTESSGVEIA